MQTTNKDGLQADVPGPAQVKKITDYQNKRNSALPPLNSEP